MNGAVASAVLCVWWLCNILGLTHFRVDFLSFFVANAGWHSLSGNSNANETMARNVVELDIPRTAHNCFDWGVEGVLHALWAPSGLQSRPYGTEQHQTSGTATIFWKLFESLLPINILKSCLVDKIVCHKCHIASHNECIDWPACFAHFKLRCVPRKSSCLRVCPLTWYRWLSHMTKLIKQSSLTTVSWIWLGPVNL